MTKMRNTASDGLGEDFDLEFKSEESGEFSVGCDFNLQFKLDELATPSTLSLDRFPSTSLESVAHKSVQQPASEKFNRGTLAQNREGSQDSTLPHGWRLAVLVLTTCLAMFLAALDLTMVAVAIPSITKQYHSTSQIGWYGSAYFLTTCVFQLIWGRIYSFFNLKWTYVIAILIFELGSLVCATSPSSIALIVGRAVQGLGAGGIISGSNTIIAFSTPLEKRSVYSSILGSVFGISSAVGPILGGVLVSKLDWPWIFWINLPLGALVVVGVVFFFSAPPRATPQAHAGLGLKDKLLKLDPLGSLLFIASMTCLLIALEWGGTDYPWSNFRVILLLVIFGVGFITWIGVQKWKGDAALVPGRIITQRSMAFGSFFNLASGGSFYLLVYYTAIWFQAVKEASPVRAGIDSIPLILGNTIGNMGAAYIVSKIGYFAPFPILSSVLMSIGCGLMTTWTPTTSSSYWIGYEAIVGLGVGVGWQQSLLVAQTMFEKKDIPVAVALSSSFKLLGGAIFESVGVNVFTNRLLINVASDTPKLDPKAILHAGASHVSSNVPKRLQHAVIGAYNDSLTDTFYICTALSALAMIGALGFEWKSIKKTKQSKVPR